MYICVCMPVYIQRPVTSLGSGVIPGKGAGRIMILLKLQYVPLQLSHLCSVCDTSSGLQLSSILM